MRHMSLKKLILAAIIILLYTRAGFHYFGPNDARYGVSLESTAKNKAKLNNIGDEKRIGFQRNLPSVESLESDSDKNEDGNPLVRNRSVFEAEKNEESEARSTPEYDSAPIDRRRGVVAPLTSRKKLLRTTTQSELSSKHSSTIETSMEATTINGHHHTKNSHVETEIESFVGYKEKQRNGEMKSDSKAVRTTMQTTKTGSKLKKLIKESKLTQRHTRNESDKTVKIDFKENDSKNITPSFSETFKTKSRLPTKSTKAAAWTFGKVNVFVYTDITPLMDNTNAYWNPLFPHFPQSSYFATKLHENDWIPRTITRRFLGYLHIKSDGHYTFKVETRMAFDFFLFDGRIRKDNSLLKFRLFKEEMERQDPKSTKSQLYEAVSEEVWLKGGKAYPFDLIHGTMYFGRFSLKIKSRNDTTHEVIDKSCLSPFYSTTSLNVTLPEVVLDRKESALSKKFNENKRLAFSRRHRIDSKSCRTGLDLCSYRPNYLFEGEKLQLYRGQWFVKRDLIWPYDHTIYHEKPNAKQKYLNESIAKSIGALVFNAISQENNGTYELRNIVHVEENMERKRYFVELDLENKQDGKLYRFSDYFLKPSEDSSRLCLPDKYAGKWQNKVTIYLICAVKNQRNWFRYLIQSIKNVIERTNDGNLHLIAVDFYSTDADIEGYLKRSKLQYTFVQLKGNFSKVIALNEGVKHVPDNNSIVFVIDLQLVIPDHIFDQARKHTIQGVMSYCPVLIRLATAEHPEHTKVTYRSVWQEIGYGMMSIFKSDWDKAGGMNEEMFGTKWGGEDWEFVDRIIMKRLEIIHQRLPGFYHIYHSTLGTWDGTKLF